VQRGISIEMAVVACSSVVYIYWLHAAFSDCQVVFCMTVRFV